MNILEVRWASDSRNRGAFAGSLIIFKGAESMRSGIRLVILMRDFDFKTGLFRGHALGGHC
jgi:hypothetical protein